jgi:hypothetical protein
VEGDEVLRARPLREELRPPPVGEDALDEVLAERHVVEPPLLLDRQLRERLDQRLREEPTWRTAIRDSAP